MKKIYVAIPYTGMEPSSYYQATRFAALLLKMGCNVFSPITHSHPFSHYDMPGDWSFWEKIDLQFIDWADEVFVIIPEEGSHMIEASTGVQAEIKYAKENKKFVTYWTYDEMCDKYERYKLQER